MTRKRELEKAKRILSRKKEKGLKEKEKDNGMKRRLEEALRANAMRLAI